MKTSDILDHPFGAAYAKRLGAPAWPGALPGAKVEDWRFTPLRALSKVAFIPAATAEDIDVQALPAHVPVIPGAARIVLVNGSYRKDLSDTGFGAGVVVSNAKADDSVSSPLASLNAAYASALAINVTGAAEKTIHIVSVGAAGAEPGAFHPRIDIKVARDAALRVVESHVGLPGQTYFSNPVIHIAVGAKASVQRYVWVAEDSDAFHLATTSVTVAAGASFEGFHLGLGGALVRQEIGIRLTGEGAAVRLNGAYALSGEEHHDFTTVMDHAVPGCTSTQVFKGVVDDQSHGVFQGRIHVARDAQKTDARMLHKALFLARGPQIDCKPELEIYADDVQCAHGAATGEINPDHLFYLAARGIDPEAARVLLVEGFIADAVNEIDDEQLRDIFAGAIGNWIRRRQARQVAL